MEIKIEKESCIGCGACIGVDPVHFDYDDEGLSTVKSNENLETSSLNDAIECCPMGAISLKNENE